LTGVIIFGKVKVGIKLNSGFEMKFKTVVLAAALLGFLSTGGANASSFTYDLALNNTTGPESGTGTFTVNGTVSNSGLSVFTAGSGLTSLTFSVDGSKFTLADELFNASVSFNNGSLISIAYAGQLNGFQLALGTFGLSYIFANLSNASLDSIGSISASAVSATPLPPAWTLMLIGLAGAGFAGYRSKRNDGMPAAA
jgi:hypothetical protein